LILLTDREIKESFSRIFSFDGTFKFLKYHYFYLDLLWEGISPDFRADNGFLSSLDIQDIQCLKKITRIKYMTRKFSIMKFHILLLVLHHLE